MRLILLLALAACTGEATVEPPAPEPVAEPAPLDVELVAVVELDVEAEHAAALEGSPALAASYAKVLAALGEGKPAAERVAAVVALRGQAMEEVPAEDASGESLRAAYDKAVAAALESFFLAYAYAIVESERTPEEKAEQIELLEAALVKSGWDWDLPARDALQAKLMMALRSAG